MRLVLLVRAGLANMGLFSRAAWHEAKEKDRLWMLPLALVGMAIFAGTVVFVLLQVYSGLYKLGLHLGRPEILFFYAMLGSTVFTFFLVIPIALSTMYFSKDIPMLIPLPLRSVEIVGAKALLVYGYAWPIHALVMLPALIVSAQGSGVSAWFVVDCLFGLFLAQLLPLALSLLFVTLLVKLVNLSRFRTLLEVVGMLLMLGAVILLQLSISRLLGTTAAGGANPVAGLQAGFTALYRALPPLAWLARAFSGPQGLSSLLLSLACGGGLAALAVWASQAAFVRDYSGRLSTGTKRKLDLAALAGYRRSSRPVSALVRREWAILTSNSTFIFQSVGEALVLPLMILIMSVLLPAEQLTPIKGFLTNTPLAGLILFGILVMMTTIGTISATSVSREGKTFPLSLFLPLSGRTQVWAKLRFHLLILYTAFLVDVAILYLMFQPPWQHLIYILPGGLAFQVLLFIPALWTDLRRPLLTWSHPQEAMKQNMNALAAIGYSFGTIGLCAILVWRLLEAGLSPLLCGSLIGGLAAVAAALLLPRLLRYADKRYGKEMEA